MRFVTFANLFTKGDKFYTLIIVFHLCAEHISCCTAWRLSLASVISCGLAVSHCRSSLGMVPWPTTCRHIGLQPSALWQKLSEELHVVSVVVVCLPESRLYARRTLWGQCPSCQCIGFHHKTWSAFEKSDSVFLLHLRKPDMLQWSDLARISHQAADKAGNNCKSPPSLFSALSAFFSPVTPQIFL